MLQKQKIYDASRGEREREADREGSERGEAIFKEPTNPEHFMRDCVYVSLSKTNLPTKLAVAS